MTPDQLIDRLLLVPHLPGRGDWSAADCFGIVELWFQELFGITITDRADIEAGHKGILRGVEGIKDWMPTEAPENHSLVLMRAGKLKYGHIGVFYNGHVLHSDERTGCVYEPIDSRNIKTKITGFLKHK